MCEGISVVSIAYLSLQRVLDQPAITSFKNHFRCHEMNRSYRAVTLFTHRDIRIGSEGGRRGSTPSEHHRVGPLEMGGDATAWCPHTEIISSDTARVIGQLRRQWASVGVDRAQGGRGGGGRGGSLE